MLTYQSTPFAVQEPKKLNGHTVRRTNVKPAIFRKSITLISACLLGLFILLFFIRLIYAYFLVNTIGSATVNSNFFNGVENLPKNYASKRIDSKGENQKPSLFATEQKYEEIASLKSSSSQFENDETNIKNTIRQFSAVIQFEKKSGMQNNRGSYLVMAVNPPLFDSFYSAIQRVGTLKEKEITNVDKTNEYQRLCAKKASLEKTLASLNELRNPIDKNSNFNLQDKILEIETILQGVEAELGYFKAGREFCTVQLYLYESAEKNIHILPAMKASFGWSVNYYPLTLLGIVLILLFKNLDKIKLQELIMSKLKT